MENIYDVIIIGSGPAGLSAAVYAKRAQMETLVIEKEAMSGGQIVYTYEVDNYLGIPGINGFDLGMKMREHVDKFGVSFITGEVEGIYAMDKIKTVILNDGKEYKTKTIVIATGARHGQLGVEGEERLSGMGVSYCATCDGAFFRGKTVAVIGGGDTAIEDAIFLARGSAKVYVVHRRNELRAAKSLQAKLFSLPNTEMVWDSVLEEIEGEDKAEAIRVRNVKTNEVSLIETDGVFIAVGTKPNSKLVEGIVEVDKGGHIVAGEDCVTSVKGIFAAGDVRTKILRQVITAAGDGATAITSVERYLSEEF